MSQMWVRTQSDTVKWTYYCCTDINLHFNKAVIGLATQQRGKKMLMEHREIFLEALPFEHEEWGEKKKKTLGFSWWGVWADLVLQQWLRRKKNKCLLVTNNDVVLVLCSGVANFTVHYLRCVNIKWHISEENKKSEFDCWRKQQQQLSLPSVWDWMGSSWQCVCDNSVINCDKSAIITNLLPSAVIYIHIHLYYLHIQREHHRFERETLSILP